MEIEFQLRPEDMPAFQTFHRKHGPKPPGARARAGCSWPWFVLLGILALGFLTQPKDNPLFLWPLAFGLGALSGGLGMLVFLVRGAGPPVSAGSGAGTMAAADRDPDRRSRFRNRRLPPRHP